MTQLASGFVGLRPKVDSSFGSQLDREVGGSLDSSGKRAGGRFGRVFASASMSPIRALGVAAVGLFAVDKTIGFFKDANAEAREAQKVSALTVSTIKATGGAANVTAAQVGKLAGAISMKTGIDDETIQSGQNLLLTFKNIRNEAGRGNDIFNQSTKTLVDMAAAMGTEPRKAAIQLGKALNDPIKGVSALGRVGVTFTAGQKDQIKTLVESGRTMDAQKIILRELNSEFGGAAEAQATAGDRASVAFGNLKEAVGTALLPVVDAALRGLTSLAITLTNGLGPAIDKVTTVIAPARDAIAGLFGGGGPGGGLMASLRSVAASITAGFLPVVRQLATTFTTVILPAALRVGAYFTANLVPILTRLSQIIATNVVPIITTMARFLVGQVYPAVFRVYTAVAQNLKPVFDQLFATIQSTILPALQRLLGKFREYQPTIQRIVLVVLKVVGTLLTLAAAILGKVLPPLIRFAAFLLVNVVRAATTVIGVVLRVISGVISFGAALVNAGKKAVDFAGKVRDKIGDALRFVREIPAKASAALGDLGSLLKDKGRALIQGLIDGITSKIKDIGSAMGKIGGKIKGFLPGSPVKEGPLTSWNNGGAGKRLVGLLVDGLGDTGSVDAAMTRLTTRIAVGAPAVDLAPRASASGVGASRGAVNLNGPIFTYDYRELTAKIQAGQDLAAAMAVLP